MNYFVSAGEASGDLHASRLMGALLQADPEARFEFLGGDEMSAVAGENPVVHYKELAYMGFKDVALHMPKLLGTLSLAKKRLSDGRPDAVILVDYPSFNLRLARSAHELGIPVYYFIAPKVWAWKSWRVKELKRYCTAILSILPFEPEWFAKRGVKADYVGNPSVEETDSALGAMRSRERFVAEEDLTNRPILALVPGSRLSEIKANLPVMKAVARKSGLQAIVAGAPGVDMDFYRRITTLPVVFGSTLELMAHSEAALVTSGTATLECALCGTPQVVCYRGNGSKLLYNTMKRVLKVDYVSLPNLIIGREAVPELLLHHCTPANVADALAALTAKKSAGRAAQLEAYAEMRHKLGHRDAAATAAAKIVDTLRGQLRGRL